MTWPSGPGSRGLIRSRPRPTRMICPPRAVDDRGVLALGVAEDDRADPEGGHAEGEPFGQGALADAGLAEQEHAGVGGDARFGPGERVGAHDLAPGEVPAEGDTGGGGTGAGDEREQPGGLGGGGRVGAGRSGPGGSSGPGVAPAEGGGDGPEGGDRERVRGRAVLPGGARGSGHRRLRSSSGVLPTERPVAKPAAWEP